MSDDIENLGIFLVVEDYIWGRGGRGIFFVMSMNEGTDLIVWAQFGDEDDFKVNMTSLLLFGYECKSCACPC